MSKLQALAAARKKKAQEQSSSGGSGVEKPMAGLSLDDNTSKAKSFSDPSLAQPSRGFPLRKRKDSNPHEKTPKAAFVEKEVTETRSAGTTDLPLVGQAEPSAFANTMFSTTSRPPPDQVNLFTLSYIAATTPIPADPFAGPSPDDVVIAAQSKGSTNPNRPKK